MKNWLPAILAVVALLVAGAVVYVYKNKAAGATPTPTPTPTEAQQLPVDQQPKVQIAFSDDSHYATVSLSNLHADQLEYDLIYNAMVNKNTIQTGVNSTATITGKDTFTEKQLLGSESSGHFTYHTNITNAVLELTLRNSQGQSVFTSTYPFTVSAGQSSSLTASDN